MSTPCYRADSTATLAQKDKGANAGLQTSKTTCDTKESANACTGNKESPKGAQWGNSTAQPKGQGGCHTHTVTQQRDAPKQGLWPDDQRETGCKPCAGSEAQRLNVQPQLFLARENNNSYKV